MKLKEYVHIRRKINEKSTQKTIVGIIISVIIAVCLVTMAVNNIEKTDISFMETGIINLDERISLIENRGGSNIDIALKESYQVILAPWLFNDTVYMNEELNVSGGENITGTGWIEMLTDWDYLREKPEFITLGDIYVNETGDTMTGDLNMSPDGFSQFFTNITSDGNITLTGTVTVGDDPKENLQVATKEYVDTALSALTLDFFLTDTRSDITDYLVMESEDLDDPESQVTSIALSTGQNQPIFNFSTNATDIGLRTLVSSVYDAHLHLEKSGGVAADVTVYWELWVRNSTNNETFIMVSEESGEVTLAGQAINLHASLAEDRSVNSTDRLVFKIYANVGGATPPTANVILSMEGTTDSHMSIRTTSSSLSGLFVKKSGDTISGDLNISNDNFNTAYVNISADGSINMSGDFYLIGDFGVRGTSTLQGSTFTGNVRINDTKSLFLQSSGNDAGFTGDASGFSMKGDSGTICGYIRDDFALWEQRQIIDLDNAKALEVRKDDDTNVFVVDTSNTAVFVNQPTASYGYGFEVSSTGAYTKSRFNTDVVVGTMKDGIFTVTTNGTTDAMNIYSGAFNIFTVLSSGRIGINTSTPQSGLHVAHAVGTTENITIGNSGTYMNVIESKTDALANADNRIKFYISKSTGDNVGVMTIAGNGRVGIGTETPDQTLEVENAGTLYAHLDGGESSFLLIDRFNDSYQSLVALQDNGVNKWLLGQRITSANTFSIYNYGTSSDVFVIDYPTGNVGIGTTSPDWQLSVVEDGDYAVSSIETYTNEFQYPILIMKRGDGTEAVPSGIDSGDFIGAIRFRGHRDATNVTDGADITAYATDNWNTSSAPTALLFSTTQLGSTARSEHLRIDDNGMIGINTTAPNATLDVAGNINVSGNLNVTGCICYDNGATCLGVCI